MPAGARPGYDPTSSQPHEADIRKMKTMGKDGEELTAKDAFRIAANLLKQNAKQLRVMARTAPLS